MAAKAELGLKEQSPFLAGNSWEFSPRNRWLSPAIYRQEYTDLRQTPEAVQRLVQGMQTTIVQEDWQFATILGNKKGFAVVFTHPKKTAITQTCPPPDFLRPNVCTHEELHAWENTSVLPNNAVNALLAGTNLLAYNCFGAYNEIERIGKKGFFDSTLQKSLYYQSGVAYILANIHTIDEEIALIDMGIQSITQEFMEKLKPYQKERDTMLGIRMINPLPFLED